MSYGSVRSSKEEYRHAAYPFSRPRLLYTNREEAQMATCLYIAGKLDAA
jgi:hypothetical protein